MQESIQHNLLPSSIHSLTPSQDNFEQFKGGRWVKEEHNRFLEAIDMYGSDWVKIASFVGTRNIAQVRSHAQKYFNKKKSDEEKIGFKPIDQHLNEQKVITRSRKQCKLENSSTVSIPQKMQEQKPRDTCGSLQKKMQDAVQKINKPKITKISKKIPIQVQNIRNQDIENMNHIMNNNIILKKNEPKQSQNENQLLLKTPKNKKKKRENCSATIKKASSMNNYDWRFEKFLVPKCITFSPNSIPNHENLSDFYISQQKGTQKYKPTIFEPSMMINLQRFDDLHQNMMKSERNVDYFLSNCKVFQYYPSKDIIPIVIVNKHRLKQQFDTKKSLFQ